MEKTPKRDELPFPVTPEKTEDVNTLVSSMLSKLRNPEEPTQEEIEQLRKMLLEKFEDDILKWRNPHDS